MSKKEVQLDNSVGLMTISTLKHKYSQKSETYSYGDIGNIIEHPHSEKVTNQKLNGPEAKWSYEFHIEIQRFEGDAGRGNMKYKTTTIVFFASNSIEKDLWVHTFKWIIECNLAINQKKEIEN